MVSPKGFRKGLFLLPWRFMDLQAGADFLQAHGMNHVSLSVRDSQGLAFYQSDRMPRLWESQDDLLANAAKIFHGAGLTLHTSIASFADMFAAQEHPEWLAVRHDGTPARPGAAWDHWADSWYYHLCPLNPAVQERLLGIVTELARYDIDGVDLDFIRFPYQPVGETYKEGWFCYCDSCRSQYKAASGAELPQPGKSTPEEWTAWIEWRAEGLAQFIRRARAILSATGKRLHGYIAVYGAPTTGPDQVDLTKSKYGQDLKRLASAFDTVQPMLYHRFVEEPLYYTRQNLFWLKTLTYFIRQTGNSVWPTVQGQEPVGVGEFKGSLENAINGGAEGVLIYPGREWHMTPERWEAVGQILGRIE